MSTYFNVYPVTPDMGLRESINAMLSHVAWDQDGFGYDAPVAPASNYRALLADYPTIIEPVRDHGASIIALVARIPAGDGYVLGDLVTELVALCNDYPVYNSDDYNALEHERVIESITDALRADDLDIDPEDMARALWEESDFNDAHGYVSHESDGSVYIPTELWNRALARLT